MNPIKIDYWAIICHPVDVHRAPEQSTRHLCGKVQNYSGCPAGKVITTSSIIGKRGVFIVTKSGSLYELGEISAEFAVQCPNAEKNLLRAIPEV